jgi:hypothetical protein
MNKRIAGCFALFVFCAVFLLTLLKLVSLSVNTETDTKNARKQPDLSNQVLVKKISLTNQDEPSIAVKNNSAAGEKAAAIKRFEETLANALGTPITFFGRVVDQGNQPVAGAEVIFNAEDKFAGPASSYKQITDAEGWFSIAGIHGANVSVGAKKEGYYSREQSGGDFYCYGSGNSWQKPLPTRDHPAIFVLEKMGSTEPLVYVDSSQFQVPMKGIPIYIDFATGKQGVNSHHYLKIESWIGDNSHRPFDWRFRLSVPQGGLIRRTNDYAFVAPETGYQMVAETNVLADVKPWVECSKEQYFVRFDDGTYARFAIVLYPRTLNYIDFKSYLNPVPGHRNLEVDRQKLVKAH